MQYQILFIGISCKDLITQKEQIDRANKGSRTWYYSNPHQAIKARIVPNFLSIGKQHW